MNLPIEQIGLSGFTLLTVIISLVTGWNKIQNKLEKHDERLQEQKKIDEQQEKRIDGINSWTHAYEKEASEHRDIFNKEIAELRGESRVTAEQYKQIMGGITEIKDRLEKLEAK